VNNGVDSILCGAMYDYGFAGDTNYATAIHHHLFESKTNGRVKRHDLIAVNICRAREPGIAGYNHYRRLCGFPKVQRFEELTDTMSNAAVEKLKMLYQ
jgi:peroxidase